MCKYCNYGDGIFTSPLQVKTYSMLNNDFSMELYICMESGKHELNLCCNDNYKQPLISKKIKYCPMCGRKFADKK